MEKEGEEGEEGAKGDGQGAQPYHPAKEAAQNWHLKQNKRVRKNNAFFKVSLTTLLK